MSGKLKALILNQRFLTPFFFIVIVLISYPHLPWNRAITYTICDGQQQLRGYRQLADKFVVVYIGDEDIRALDGWPLSRDYYGYFVHLCREAGARVIAMDLLFARPDSEHPEFDSMLSALLGEAGNVCLPMAFSEMQAGQTGHPEIYGNLARAEQALLPDPLFTENVTGLGFSNLGDEGIVRKLPLLATSADSLFPSFGLELARLFLSGNKNYKYDNQCISFPDNDGTRFRFPVDVSGEIRLNHFGSIDHLQSVSFVQLLKEREKGSDLSYLNDKLVLLIVSASGVSTTKITPFAQALPASLLHLNLAENLIEQNYLREMSFPFQAGIIFLMLLCALVMHRFVPVRYLLVAGLSFFIVYLATLQLIFVKINLVVPLFYPAITFFAVFIYTALERHAKKRFRDESVKHLLKQTIRIKETELETINKHLSDARQKLALTSSAGEEMTRLAEDREQAVQKLEKELDDLKEFQPASGTMRLLSFPEIIHAPQSPIRTALEMVAKVSGDDIPVLIYGETGTGKELIARAIHKNSKRRHSTFIAVNCGALSENLLDSELFGHEKGSFTGAAAQRKGRFELANGGTIFLDEISETSPAFQARLLRVLQEGTFERVGAEKTIKTNVRIIAATNKNLKEKLEQSMFRADLFYRLNGFPISLPPLRERQLDISFLAIHFLAKHNPSAKFGFSERAIEAMLKYAWPGNVREMENAVRRAAIMAGSDKRNIIQITDLPLEIKDYAAEKNIGQVHRPIEAQVLEMMRELQFSHASISQTARALGNKDRGTITEYFRGICFEYLVKNDFDITRTVQDIVAGDDAGALLRVQKKMDLYLSNLFSTKNSAAGPEQVSELKAAAYKGLPRKYHTFLEKIIDHYPVEQE